MNKEEKKKYTFISELTWGCIPIDFEWAISTGIYKEMETKLFPIHE
jgi:hypothetical protein